MCRTSEALDRQQMHDRGLHAGSMGGNFAAAAVASRLLNLHAEQIKYALALAGIQATGLSTWRHEREHIDKALSRAGLRRATEYCSTVGTSRVHRRADNFEGPHNFLDSFSENAKPTALIKISAADTTFLEYQHQNLSGRKPIQATLHGYFTLVKRAWIGSKKIFARLSCVCLRSRATRSMTA
jgi:hypothetical protein